MSEKEEKKNKKLGWMLAGVFHVLLILILFAFKMDLPTEPLAEPLIILDYTAGSSSKGGSSAASTPTETPSEDPDPNPENPVVTQEKESPVVKSSKPKGDNSPKTSTTKPTKKSNPNASASGAFGGNGNGKSNGDGDGNEEGIGNGKSGPGVTGKIGKLGTGEGRAPSIDNPTNEVGRVAIKITIDKKGKIVSVEVLSNHRKTTTNSPALFAQAKKDGYKYKFKPDANRKELTTGIRVINYVLQ